MIKNDRFSEEEKPLTVKQQALLALLLAGKSITDAAAELKISEITARRWQKLAVFDRAYQSAKDALMKSVLAGLQRQSIATLKKHALADVEVTPSSQMAAIRLIFDQVTILNKIEEFEKTVAELKDLLSQQFGR